MLLTSHLVVCKNHGSKAAIRRNRTFFGNDSYLVGDAFFVFVNDLHYSSLLGLLRTDLDDIVLTQSFCRQDVELEQSLVILVTRQILPLIYLARQTPTSIVSTITVDHRVTVIQQNAQSLLLPFVECLNASRALDVTK